MSKLISIIPFLLLVIPVCSGDDLITKHVLESFDWLTDSGTIPNVYFDKNLASLNADPLKNKYADRYVGEIRFAKNSLYVKVSTTLGPSDDPTVILKYEYKKKKYVKVFRTFAVVIPGDGSIYSFSDKKIYIGNQNQIKYPEKYVFIDGEFGIIEPPLYFTDYQTSAHDEIIIYKDMESREAVEIIPKTNSVYVIGVKFFNKKIFLLIRTQFGLVGWHELSVHDVHNTSINGVYISPD